MELDRQVSRRRAFDVERAGLGCRRGAADAGIDAVGADGRGLNGVAGIDAEGGRDGAGEVAVEDGGLEDAGLRSGGRRAAAGFPDEFPAVGFDSTDDLVALEAPFVSGVEATVGPGRCETDPVAVEGSGELQVAERAGYGGAFGQARNGQKGPPSPYEQVRSTIGRSHPRRRRAPAGQDSIALSMPDYTSAGGGSVGQNHGVAPMDADARR
jgi:hypothetical protein